MPLIELAKEHGAIFGAQDAVKAGLPAIIVNPQDDQWKLIWRLYAKYLVLGFMKARGRRRFGKAQGVELAEWQAPDRAVTASANGKETL
jgi:hypothetical protein